MEAYRLFPHKENDSDLDENDDVGASSGMQRNSELESIKMDDSMNDDQSDSESFENIIPEPTPTMNSKKRIREESDGSEDNMPLAKTMKLNIPQNLKMKKKKAMLNEL